MADCRWTERQKEDWRAWIQHEKDGCCPQLGDVRTIGHTEVVFTENGWETPSRVGDGYTLAQLEYLASRTDVEECPELRADFYAETAAEWQRTVEGVRHIHERVHGRRTT